MKILFKYPLNSLWRDELADLEAEFPGVAFIYRYAEEDYFDTEELSKHLKGADAIVSGPITEKELESANSLKTLFVPYVGLNSFPLRALAERGIVISNAHGNDKITAERGLALTFSLLGRIVYFHNELKLGYWHRSHHLDSLWHSLTDLPVTILGAGHIGKAYAEYISPFTTRIVGFKRDVSRNSCRFPVTNNLAASLSEAKLVFCSLPLTNETRSLFNEQNIDLLYDKFVVNVGRGAIFEEDSFYRALAEKKILGAGIDVWYQYPSNTKPEPVMPSKQPFHQLNNIVMSPHKASHSDYGVIGNIKATAENLRAYLRTGKPKHIADANRGY